MSVFEPYPMRDTVQHFCEKHLDKIKAYMDKVSVRIPPPAKCTIEGKKCLNKIYSLCILNNKYNFRKKSKKIGKITLCMPGKRSTLFIFTNIFHNENKKSTSMDSLNVYRVTSAISTCVIQQGCICNQFETLLGYVEM